MRFSFIDAEKATTPVAKLCRALEVSRAGFYAWGDRPESRRAREDRRLGVLVREAHERIRRTYGSPRIHAELAAHGVHVSRKRVIRLMQSLGLCGRARRAYRPTTDSDHDQPVAPNLLARQFVATAPNQRWVGDTTELIAPGSRLFLAAILDLYSRYVVGWAVSTVNDRHLVLRALHMAIEHRCPSAGLLHHSDRGSPYASEDYQRVLAHYGITCSMSRRANCYDNAAMESWFSTVKSEEGEHFESLRHAERELFEYIERFYNTQRRHSTLSYVSPAEHERTYWQSVRVANARPEAMRKLQIASAERLGARGATVARRSESKRVGGGA